MSRATVASLRDVLACLEQRAPGSTAEDWDRVGLVCGDPQQSVRSVWFAVDPTSAVIDDALAAGADLLVTHHPMLLRGVSSIAETDSRGRRLAALTRARCALFTMHTNADRATGGVNDALADAIGMSVERRAIVADTAAGPARIVTYVPVEAADAVIAALAGAGAGRLGDYDLCAYWTDGAGQFRPGVGADPAIGRVGELTRVTERRIEMVAPDGVLGDCVRALRAAHPYEEPAFGVVPAQPVAVASGSGRIGTVPDTTVADLARHLAAVLPPTAGGVRVAGDPSRPVTTVALCGGAGDSLLGAVQALRPDVYVTSDLRHHPVSDFIAEGTTALIDIPHASGESLWLTAWADRLGADLAARGAAISTHVSDRNTDPWTAHYPGSPA